VPGYTGYVPNKKDFYGCTFRQANDAAVLTSQAGFTTPPKQPRSRQGSLSPEAQRLLHTEHVGNHVPTEDKAVFWKKGGREDKGHIGPLDATSNANWMASLRAGGQPNLRGEWRYLRSPEVESAARVSRYQKSPPPISPDRQIPGYMGHLPRVDSENIYGMTFHDVADSASKVAGNDTIEQSTAEARSPSNRRSKSPFRKTVSPRRQIAGYGGYVPGVRPENIYGLSYKEANQSATRFTREASVEKDRDGGDVVDERCSQHVIPMAKTKHSIFDSPLSHSRSLRNLRASPRGETDSVPSSPGPTWDKREGFRSNSRSVSRGRDMPGYQGYVPRKKPQANLYGMRFKAANDLARDPPDMAREGPQTPGNQSPKQATKRDFISGYQGYVPKVGPENIYGLGVREACKRAVVDVKDAPLNAATVNSTWSESLRDVSPLTKRGLSPDRRITGEIPSHLEHVPRKNRSGVIPPTGKCMPSNRTAEDSFPGPMPGYTGYIPRKGPQSVVGASFSKVIDRAATGIDPVAQATTETTLLQSDGLV
jgi:hypothetical protein